jgi:hypothetical protein
MRAQLDDRTRAACAERVVVATFATTAAAGDDETGAVDPRRVQTIAPSPRRRCRCRSAASRRAAAYSVRASARGGTGSRSDRLDIVLGDRLDAALPQLLDEFRRSAVLALERDPSEQSRWQCVGIWPISTVRLRISVTTSPSGWRTRERDGRAGRNSRPRAARPHGRLLRRGAPALGARPGRAPD